MISPKMLDNTIVFMLILIVVLSVNIINTDVFYVKLADFIMIAICLLIAYPLSKYRSP